MSAENIKSDFSPAPPPTHMSTQKLVGRKKGFLLRDFRAHPGTGAWSGPPKHSPSQQIAGATAAVLKRWSMEDRLDEDRLLIQREAHVQSAVTGVAPGHTTQEMRKGMHTPASPCMRIAESVWNPLEMCSDLGGGAGSTPNGST